MPGTTHINQAQQYRIVVRGLVESGWTDYLGGMTIKANQETGQKTTILSGALVDQAALIGVLNNLYNLGFSILLVEQQDFYN